MTQMIAERINEIRKNKNVSVQTIVDNGISKSKYFAFIRGERDLAISDLQILMDVLTISFAELVVDTDVVQAPFTLNLLRARDLTLTELEVYQKALWEKYQRTQLVAYYQYNLAFQYLIAHKQEVDCKPFVTAIYEELKDYQLFTFFEIQLFSIIADKLTPKRFYRMYEIFTKSIGIFAGYMPMPIYLTILRIHYYALVHLMRPTLKSLPTMLFVLDAIINQPARPSNVELFMLRQFAKMLKSYYIENSPAADRQFAEWVAVAVKRGSQEVKMTYDTMSFPGLWQALTMKRHHMKHDAPSMFSTTYDELPKAEMAASFGVALRYLIKGKHINSSELTQYGVTRSKLYRIMHQEVAIRLEDLFDMMKYLRLLPADLTVFFQVNPNSKAKNRFAAFDVNPYDYQTVAKQALAEYGRTGNHADYETALEFQIYVNQQLSDFDPTSIIQIDLAKTITDYLLHLDEWHEAEHRLVTYSFVDLDDVELIIKRLGIADEYMHNRQVFRAPISSILNNAEFVLLKYLLEDNREAFDRILKIAEGEVQRDPRIFAFATWRWRLDVYRVYQMFFDYPEVGLAAFEDFVCDYQRLTGNQLFKNERNFIADTLRYHFNLVNGIDQTQNDSLDE